MNVDEERRAGRNLAQIRSIIIASDFIYRLIGDSTPSRKKKVPALDRTVEIRREPG